MAKKIVCPDCGLDAVNHRLEKASVFLDWLTKPFFKPFELLGKTVSKSLSFLNLSRLSLPFFKLLTRLHLGKILNNPDSEDNLRTKAIWESASKLGINLCQFRFLNKPATGQFIAQKNGRIVSFDAVPRPNNHHSKSLNWMDNKNLMKQHFIKAGLPVAKGGVAFSINQAKKIFTKIDGPIIIKPNLGSRSRHTTTHITNINQLTEAFYKAKQLSPWVMVEEELQGMVFRITLIGGQVAAVLRREFPHVIGDGVLTIRQLVVKENQNPLRFGPIFHHLNLDEDALIELKRQGYDFESVIPNNQMVTLNQKAGRGYGASTTDFTESIHPENVKMFEKAGKILNDAVVGIDFIVQDITKPYFEQLPAGIIECNSAPFLDLHHWPLYGKPRPVAEVLWKLVFNID